MSGDHVNCPLFIERRDGNHQCRARQDPETLGYKPAECVIGIGGTCPWPKLRDRELARLMASQNSIEKDAKFRAQDARLWAKRRLDRLIARFGGAA